MNKITDLIQQTNHSDRFSVYINGNFSFGISELDLLKFSLKVGNELSDDELDEILCTIDETKCQDYANSLVCARMYTKRELSRKLSGKSFSDDVISRVLKKLEEYGYVDDKAYTELYISEMKQKFGLYKLKQKLYEKGISSDIIEHCLNDLDNADVAVSYLRIKFRNQTIGVDEKQKALRFLAQKGFAYDDAYDAIRTYMEELNGTYDE